MKKIIATFLVLLSMPLNTFASGCLIKGGPPDILLDYIKNNKIVIGHISGAEKTSSNDGSVAGFINRKYSISNSLTETEGVFNDAFSFRSYNSYFKYNAVYPMLNEIPIEVKRDYKLLKDEINSQIETLKRISKEGKSDYIVEDPCAGVEGICNFEKGGTASEILGQLLKNTDDVIDLFSWTIMGEQHNMKVGDINLVKNNFKLELEKYYSPRAYNLCNGEGEGFYVMVKEAIEKIKGLTTAAEDGIKEWREAWAQLYGQTPSEEAELEKKLLKEYLAEIGLKTDDSAVINKNLEKYNLEGLNRNNNFITNTFKVIEGNIAREVESFKKEVLGDFLEEEEISHKEVKKRAKNAENTQNIQARIVRMYESELPFASIGDSDTETLRAKIIESHSSLDVSIRILNRAIPKSQKICSQQCVGEGLCQ